MSSLTKDQFISQLKVRSGIAKSMEDDDLSVFVDIGLREISERMPKVMWDIDNDVVPGQLLYDYPSGAIKVLSVRTSDTRKPILFTTEDQGNGNKIYLGAVKQHSWDKFMKIVFYDDPTSYSDLDESYAYSGDISSVLGYSLFDVEYVVLQTMTSISDRLLEALSLYVEYLAYNLKESEAADQIISTDGESEQIESMTDSDASGASVTIKYASRQQASNSYRTLAESKLKLFENKLGKMPFGMRGV